MNPRIKKYKPPLTLIDDGSIIDIKEEPESVNILESIVLEEHKHNLIGNLIAFGLMFIIPLAISLGPIEVDYKDTQTKIAFYILGILMVTIGFFLVLGTLRKLRKMKNRGRMEINSEGIKLSNTTPYKNGQFSWLEIDEIAIKVFPNRFAGEPYLLFTTEKGDLIDVNFSLLKKRDEGFSDKDEWKKSFGLKHESFEDIIGCIQKYLR